MSSGTGEPLHITNGDAVAGRILQGGLAGAVLPWRDALHEGPVPGGLSLDEMSRVRARFVADRLGTESFEGVAREFEDRDATLKAFRRRSEVTLWFEHDLYDQLQLIQILHWMSLRQSAGTRVSLVCIGSYPGVEPFHGLGQLTPAQLAGLHDEREEVTPERLSLGDRAWEAFSSDRPLRLQELMRDELSALPHLRPALMRHLEQYPSTRDGLSRTERQILEAVEGGENDLETVFRVSQLEREERPFMGDVPFLLHVGYLNEGAEPLVDFEDKGGLPSLEDRSKTEGAWSRCLRTTAAGRKVLGGQVDRLRYQSIDRWLGGVHLQGDPAWRWGHRNREIVDQSR